jgi:hypothetical protein
MAATVYLEAANNMSGPSIRELKAIVESFNREIEEASRMPNGDPVPDSLMVDIEDTTAWKNRNNARTDFEPKTNMCPDCEGTGDRLTGSDHAFPGLGYECERCNGEGAVFEDGDDGGLQYENPGKWEGKEIEVTGGQYKGVTGEVQDVLVDRNEEGIKEAEFTVNLKSGQQIVLYPSEWGHDQLKLVRDEDQENWMLQNPFESINEAASRKDFRLVANLISKIEDPVVRDSSADDHATMFALQNPRFDKDKFMAACGAGAEAELGEGDKPYATMKDGPDKYLFRKDNKQKLVGSADNEPDDGEEELEETDMDKDIREMQIAAGIIEDCDQDKEKNDDGECSPFTHGDENVEMVKEGEGEDCPECNGSGQDGYDACFACNGSGIAEELVQDDLLLAPRDKAGPEVDDGWDNSGNVSVRSGDDRIEPELDRQTDFDAPPRDDGDDSYDMNEAPGKSLDDYFGDVQAMTSKLTGISSASDTNSDWGVGDYVVPTWDGANEHGEPLKVTGVYGDQVRVVDDYGNSELMSPEDLRLAPTESLGEEPNDDDRIIDVGDDEDYEDYSNFDSEFEDMLGGSSDMPETGYNAGMYEMNDLRRLAGLEELVEEACEEIDEIAPVVAAVARGAGAAVANKAVDSLTSEDAGGADVVAYDISDEKAYYVMQDVLGAELDFGQEDEVLVPSARNDQVLAALGQQGLEKGVAFNVAGEQYEDDLQNGYNDRSFSDGQDYFPKGATSQPATDLGPTAGDMGDNPMSNKMRSIEKDDVYESMKLAYRRHRKA